MNIVNKTLRMMAVAVVCSPLAYANSLHLNDSIAEGDVAGVWLTEVNMEPVYQSGYLGKETDTAKKAADNKWWHKIEWFYEDSRPYDTNAKMAVVDREGKILKTFSVKVGIKYDVKHANTKKHPNEFRRKGTFHTLKGKLTKGTSWSPYQIKAAEFMGAEKDQNLRFEFEQNTGGDEGKNHVWLIVNVSPLSKKAFSEMGEMVDSLGSGETDEIVKRLSPKNDDE